MWSLSPARLGLRDTALRGPEGRDTRYGDTLGGSRGCKRIMASPRQDIPGRPDSTGDGDDDGMVLQVDSEIQDAVEGDGDYGGIFDNDEDEMIESLLEVSQK